MHQEIKRKLMHFMDLYWLLELHLEFLKLLHFLNDYTPLCLYISILLVIFSSKYIFIVILFGEIK
jgi:hypothetical protein